MNYEIRVKTAHHDDYMETTDTTRDANYLIKMYRAAYGVEHISRWNNRLGVLVYIRAVRSEAV